MSHEDRTIAAADSTVSAQAGAAADVPFQPPSDLGPLELLRELGRGGQSSVWLARHRLLERRVVVKFLRGIATTPASASLEHLQLFLEGARAAATLDHPNLNRILHADIADGVPYLVTDYVDGQSLAQVLRAHGALTLAEAAAVLLDVCDALAVLHAADIVHRDIKPGNVLITREGRAILTDFGLSGWDRGDSKGRVAGTPRYMAPECFEGRFSARTDVYAAGLIARELLTGDTGTDAIWPTTPRERTLRASDPVPPDMGAELDTDVLPGNRTAPIISMISALLGVTRTRPQMADTGHQPCDDVVLTHLKMTHAEPVARAWQEITSRCTNENPVLRFKSAAQLLEALQRAARRDVSIPAGRDRLSRRLQTAQREIATPRSITPAVEATQFQDRLKRFINRVDRQAANPAHEAPATGRLGTPEVPGSIKPEVPCVTCRYSLAGKAAHQRCPECGTQVARSMDPSRFWFAPAERIRRMWAAQLLFLAAGAIFLVLRATSQWLPEVSAFWVPALTPLAGAISLVGLMMFVTGWLPKHASGLRWTSRVAAVLPVLIVASYLLARLTPRGAGSFSHGVWQVMRAVGPSLTLAGLVIYQYACLTDFFGRRFLFRVLLWSTLVVAAFPIWSRLTEFAPPDGGMASALKMIGILFLPFLVTAPIMQVAVLFWFRQIYRFKAQASSIRAGGAAAGE